MTEYYLAYENQSEQAQYGRITEELIEQELLEIIETIRTEGVAYMEESRDDAEAYIENVKDETNAYTTTNKNSAIATGKEIKGDISFEYDENGVVTSDVDKVVTSTSNKGTLGKYYVEAKGYSQDTDEIAPNTEALIENDIRITISNGYNLNFANDDSGNVTASLDEK